MPDKDGWRRLLLADRRAVSDDERERDASRLTDTLVGMCSGLPAGPVCGFVPMASEPGSAAMLDALRAAGREVLVPVIPESAPHTGSATADAGPLSWGRYLGAEHLARGPLGIRRPRDADRGPAAIADAVLVLVPALAVDLQGVRLGRGGGWYDRTLRLAPAGAPVLAVIRDDELVERLPSEPHDIPVTGVLTPTGGVRLLR